VVHPASFDLAKFSWTREGGAPPPPTEQSLHLVHTVFAVAVHALDFYVPLAHTEQVEHIEFAEPEHPLDLYLLEFPPAPPTAFPIITNFFQSLELFRPLVFPHLYPPYL